MVASITFNTCTHVVVRRAKEEYPVEHFLARGLTSRVAYAHHPSALCTHTSHATNVRLNRVASQQALTGTGTPRTCPRAPHTIYVPLLHKVQATKNLFRPLCIQIFRSRLFFAEPAQLILQLNALLSVHFCHRFTLGLAFCFLGRTFR